MTVELDKIKITLPEGVELTSEPSQTDDGFKFGVTPQIDVKGRIEVIYNGDTQYVHFATPQIHVTSFTASPEANTLFGGVVKLKATFDGKFDSKKFKITAPKEWTLVTPITEDDGALTTSYRAPHIAGNYQFTCQYEGDKPNSLNMKVIDPDNIFLSAAFDKPSVVKGSNVNLVLTFEKDVTVDDQPSQIRGIENLSEVSRSSSGKQITIEYTAQGEASVTAEITCHEGKDWETTRDAELTITAE